MIRAKLILVVMLLAISGTQARVWSQSERMTVRTETVSMAELFRMLQKQTNLRFVFNHEEVQPYTVSVDMADKTLSEILDAVLADKPLRYEFTTTHVIISRAEAKTAAIQRQQPQKTTVSGTVKGENGVGLVGVAVVVKGTYVGTSTDGSGRYLLTFDTDPGAVLQFSMIGMQPLEAPLDGRTTVDVVMKEVATEMGEVVITGYYNIDRESYTGASRTITREELQMAGNQNVLASLRNIDPSFTLVQNNEAGSNPNVLPEFQIRGQSSFSSMRDDYTSNPNMPLFILDGFEVNAEKVFDMDIYRVNSITVLKDAAATAIYGSRAANGVVVITTVAPKPGRLYVTYNMDLTFTAADLTGYDVLSAAEKLAFEEKVGVYGWADEGSAANRIALEQLHDQRLRNVLSGYDTYWLDKPLNKLAVSHKHTLRIDGGSENFRYSIDVNYNDQRGAMKKSKRTRDGIAMNFQYLVGRFTLSNEMSYNHTNAVESPYGTFDQYVRLNPYYRYTDDNGNYLFVLDNDNRPVDSRLKLTQYNPLYNTTLNTRNDSRYYEFQDKLNVVWNVSAGLMIRGNFSITHKNNRAVVFKPAKHTDFAEWTQDNFGRRGYYQDLNGESTSVEGQLTASYQKQWGRHVMTVNAAGEISQQQNSWRQVVAEGFPNDNLDDLGSALQYQKDGVPTSDESVRRVAGVFASANYIYDDRYIVDLTGRMDASSVFGSDNRWAPFWSAGAGWNIHNESFLRDAAWVDRLKLRASYGLTGSVNYNPYQAMTTYRYLSGTQYYYGQGAMLMALGNKDLGWQKVHQLNVGLDLDMWNNRIQLTGNYYIKTSKDVLTDITLAPSTGFSTYKANLGEIENKGFDVSLRIEPYRDTNRGISLNVFATATHNKNILKKISNSLQAYNDSQDDFLDSKPNSGTEASDGLRNRPRVRYLEGASINSIWVNPSLGIDAVSGYEIFRTRAGGTTTEWSSDNYVIGGCTDPKLTGTFGLNFQIKRLRLNASFFYSMGGDIYNQTLVDRVQDVDFRYNVDRRVLTDRWFSPGDVSKYETVSDSYRVNRGKRTKPTSRFIERENYLELSTVNASYELNPSWIKRIGLQQLRITFYMNDVFRASTVKIERGISYPFARNFSLGLQARF